MENMIRYAIAAAALLVPLTGIAANENSNSATVKDDLFFEIRNSSATLAINVIRSGRAPAKIISQIERYVRACAQISTDRGFDIQGNWVVHVEWGTFKGLKSGEMKQQTPPGPEEFLKCVNSRFPKSKSRKVAHFDKEY